MLKMSFYDGTLDRDTLSVFIKNTDKEVRITHGLKYRNPMVNNQPIDKAEALEIIATESYLDATEYDTYIELNTYSANDLY